MTLRIRARWRQLTNPWTWMWLASWNGEDITCEIKADIKRFLERKDGSN